MSVVGCRLHLQSYYKATVYRLTCIFQLLSVLSPILPAFLFSRPLRQRRWAEFMCPCRLPYIFCTSASLPYLRKSIHQERIITYVLSCHRRYKALWLYLTRAFYVRGYTDFGWYCPDGSTDQSSCVCCHSIFIR
jgi:hypothetical protein